MFHIMLALHVLFAILAVGPLVHVTTTASRGLRQADAAATRTSARSTRIYALVSILTVVFGFGVMSSTSPFTGEPVAQFSETWIWLSLVLWAIAMVIALAVTAPALGKAAKQITAGDATGSRSAVIAASGGLIGLLFVAVVFLMVYQPGG